MTCRLSRRVVSRLGHTAAPRPCTLFPRRLATHASEKEVGAPSVKEKLHRGDYATLTETHVKTLRSFLQSDSSILSALKGGNAGAEDLLPFNQDWMNKYKGKSQCVVKPKTVEEVSKVLAYCNQERIAVVPQGGNTGLVGGSVPVFDEIVISLGNLNQIRSFDEMMGVLVCDAGCILESLDNYLAERGHMMPLDLGAKGSCQIGGNVATNAGGLRLLRYGSLHGTVLGIEAVLPSGEIVNTLTSLRKDNTGFDLKQLFIGSEGTIGIITGISILTPRRPLATNVALLGLDSFEKVKKAFTEAKTGLNEILSAFEFWDKDAMQVVEWHHGDESVKGLEGKHEFYCLVETSGSNAEHDAEKLQTYLEGILESEIVQDGVLAQDESQAQSLWAIREGIPEACGKLGSTYKYDMSIPIDRYYDFISETRARLEDQGKLASDMSKKEKGKPIKKVVGFGHIGDCNVHLNIIADAYEPSTDALIEPFVYEWVAKEHGSISAEHGLGLMKAPYLSLNKSNVSIEMMRRLKTLFDPNGILMPYKFLPPLPQHGQGKNHGKLVQTGDSGQQNQTQVSGH